MRGREPVRQSDALQAEDDIDALLCQALYQPSLFSIVHLVSHAN